MRALQVTEFGDPSALKVSEVDERDPGASEVKVRVEGVGVGYFDGLFLWWRVNDPSGRSFE